MNQRMIKKTLIILGKKYNQILENFVKRLDEKQLDSIEMLENIMSSADRNDKSEYRTKIQMIADEATKIA